MEEADIIDGFDPSQPGAFPSTILLGSGDASAQAIACLHARVEYGIAQLGGQQQEGLQGSGPFDPDEKAQMLDSIREVVRDVARALTGLEIAFLVPKDPVTRRTNGGVECDMEQGPCACGAWH